MYANHDFVPQTGKTPLKKLLATAVLAVTASWLAGPAQAEVPFFNAVCPGRIEVHADDGGPVFINGQQARLKRFSRDYYEARLGRVTVSVSVNPDGTPEISYTARGGANGVCRLRNGRSSQVEGNDDGDGYGNGSGNGYGENRPRRRPAGVPLEALSAFCRGEASAEFGVRPSRITTNMAFRSGGRYVVQGNYPDRGRTAFFNCWFDRDGNFLSID